MLSTSKPHLKVSIEKQITRNDYILLLITLHNITTRYVT